MDLQSRKLEFVQEFLKLQSEESIRLFEKLLTQLKTEGEEEVSRMSKKQLEERIYKSLEDSENDRVTEVNELLSQMKRWR